MPSHAKPTAVLVSFVILLCSLIGKNDVTYASQQDRLLRIEGIVLDELSNPVAGAEVHLSTPSKTLIAVSDAAGHFHFEAVPKALITLRVQARGFSILEQRIDSIGDLPSQITVTLTPVPLSEAVTVVVTGTESRIGETAASVIVLNSDDLKTTAAATVDDALRQVAGFSLFRRSGSRTANPTTQGVSLRALGPSGASRALVLLDGFPLNDPFGGWIYWSRIPRLAIAEVEVLQGGASYLYGGSAIGGVVNISTKSADSRSLSLETSYGNQQTPDASLYLADKKGTWSGAVAAEVFHTNGYVTVSEKERGRIDTLAGSRHSIVDLKLKKSFSGGSKVFGGASFFGESRTNGTPLQINRTHLRTFITGIDWQRMDLGLFTGRAYGTTEVFDQTFSAVSADRNTETITRIQRTPAQATGISAQWSRGLGRSQTLVAGFDAHEVRGASDEIVYVTGRANSLVGAGGRQRSGAIYLEDLFKIGPRLFINAGTRFDHWRNYAGLSGSKPLSTGTSTLNRFPSRHENVFSPRLSVLYKFSEHVAATALVTRAFRAPTLNELYRSFRVGSVVTLANEQLNAERMMGGEGGVRVVTLNGGAVLHASGFWNEVTGPIANITLLTTLSLITRQRQNLGRTQSRGLEIEADARMSRHWNLSAGYLFADATVVRFPANTALEGLLIPQVPRQQLTFQARYTNPATVTLGMQGRASSSQFDDDQNIFRLRQYFTLDTFVSRRLSHKVELFAAAENLFNQRYEIGKTPVTTLGPPILLRAGLRLHLGGK